jgi:hypothetical protein
MGDVHEGQIARVRCSAARHRHVHPPIITFSLPFSSLCLFILSFYPSIHPTISIQRTCHGPPSPRAHSTRKLGDSPANLLINQGDYGHTTRAPPGASLPSGSRARNLRILDPAFKPLRCSGDPMNRTRQVGQAESVQRAAAGGRVPVRRQVPHRGWALRRTPALAHTRAHTCTHPLSTPFSHQASSPPSISPTLPLRPVSLSLLIFPCGAIQWCMAISVCARSSVAFLYRDVAAFRGS